MPNIRLETDWQVSPRNAQHVCRQTGANEDGPIFEPIAAVCGVGNKPKQRAKQIAASGRAFDLLVSFYQALLADDLSREAVCELANRADSLFAEVEG